MHLALEAQIVPLGIAPPPTNYFGERKVFDNFVRSLVVGTTFEITHCLWVFTYFFLTCRWNCVLRKKSMKILSHAPMAANIPVQESLFSSSAFRESPKQASPKMRPQVVWNRWVDGFVGRDFMPRLIFPILKHVK